MPLVAACADQAEQARHGDDAVVHASAPRAAGARRALLPVARLRASPRLRTAATAAADEADALTLGSGAIAGTSYAVDTERLARALGFSRVVSNSMDASSDRDFVASFLYAVSLAMVHLSRIAEDLIIFTGEEHGFFELADASATGSSMMPQKKNPDPLELVRGKTGRAIGRLTGWLATMKGLPSGYNKDLQEDKEAVFDAEATLAVSLAATRAVVSRLSVNAERSGRAASGLLLATDVADYLVVARDAVPPGPRSGRRHGPPPACRGARLQLPDDGGVARGERDVRRRRAAGGHGARVGAGPPDAAVDQSGCGPRRAGGVPGLDRNVLRLSGLGIGLWLHSFGPSHLIFHPPHPEGIAPGEFMQQRRVRLGDILDDYCPRERRITNHAVVAMIEDEVKQTRCTTCDADHEYKQAKVPAPRRKKPGAAPRLVVPADGDHRSQALISGDETVDELLDDTPDLLPPTLEAATEPEAVEAVDVGRPGRVSGRRVPEDEWPCIVR